MGIEREKMKKQNNLTIAAFCEQFLTSDWWLLAPIPFIGWGSEESTTGRMEIKLKIVKVGKLGNGEVENEETGTNPLLLPSLCHK